MFYTRQQQRKQLTAYQVLVLFCRQDFGNSGRKVSGTLEIISKKVSKILEVVGHSVQNFGNFWTKFEQLWNCSHKQGFQCTMEAKNSFNNGAMVQKSSFKISFFLQS